MNIWIPVFEEETKPKKQRHKRHRKENHFVSLRRYEASRFITEEYYKYRRKNEHKRLARQVPKASRR